MMRLLLDTCVIIDWLTDTDPFDDHVWDILNDPDTKLERLTLLSSDQKFGFYCSQGLDLLEY